MIATAKTVATAVGILIGLFGLVVDFFEIVPAVMVVSDTNPVARSLFDTLIYFWTFFTHVSNLGLVLVYLAVLTGWRWLGWFARPRTMAAIGGYILLVMIYYHVALSGLYPIQGWLLVANYTLHYVAPIYYLVWWAAFAPHGRLRYGEIPMMLIIGIVYLAWALIRGAIVNEYPYDIIDAGKFGYGQVAIGILILLIMVVVFCLVMVTADRLLARWRPAKPA